jgi:hypothetical protein
VVASSNLVIPTTDKALIIARLSMLFVFYEFPPNGVVDAVVDAKITHWCKP